MIFFFTFFYSLLLSFKRVFMLNEFLNSFLDTLADSQSCSHVVPRRTTGLWTKVKDVTDVPGIRDEFKVIFLPC